MVHIDAQGFKTVDYSRLTPVLVEAMKEQQVLIEEQSNELKLLREQMNSLVDEVMQMKMSVNGR